MEWTSGTAAVKAVQMDYNLAAEVFHWNRNSSTSGPEVPSEDLVNQRRGLSLPVEPANGNMVTGRWPLMRNTIKCPPQTAALLRVATETRLLHGIDGVPQKLMGVLLASKAKMSRNFCKRQNALFQHWLPGQKYIHVGHDIKVKKEVSAHTVLLGPYVTQRNSDLIQSKQWETSAHCCLTWFQKEPGENALILSVCPVLYHYIMSQT